MVAAVFGRHMHGCRLDGAPVVDLELAERVTTKLSRSAAAPLGCVAAVRAAFPVPAPVVRRDAGGAPLAIRDENLVGVAGRGERAHAITWIDVISKAPAMLSQRKM